MFKIAKGGNLSSHDHRRALRVAQCFILKFAFFLAAHPEDPCFRRVLGPFRVFGLSRAREPDFKKRACQ